MNHFEQNILTFPEQLHLGALTFKNLEKLKKAKPDALVICGMGGSGIPGTLLQNIAKYASIDLPIVVWKDFGLPHLSYQNPLYIFVSYSGNTAETLSGFRLARKAKLRAVVTSGGALLTAANRLKIARAIVPAGMVPRQAVGFQLYGLLGIIKAIFPAVSAPDLHNSINPQSLASIGTSLATKLKNKTVLICTPTDASHVALVFKAQLTETGKTPAFCETYPELNHIGIVGFDRNPKGLVSLFPVTGSETALTKKLISIESQILAKRGITPITVSIPGKNPLETTVNATLIAMWTGLHLAKLHKVDPEKNETVKEIKKVLKQRGLSNQ